MNEASPGFAKPIVKVVQPAIAARQQIRPNQPPTQDPKTGEPVQRLFSFRGLRAPMPR